MLGRRFRHQNYESVPANGQLIVVDDEIDLGIKDSSHFYAKLFLADLDDHAWNYRVLSSQSSQSDLNNVVPDWVITAVKGVMFGMGATTPFGKSTCKVCSGFCRTILPFGVDSCREICVTKLGEYKGDKPQPKCEDLTRP